MELGLVNTSYQLYLACIELSKKVCKDILKIYWEKKSVYVTIDTHQSIQNGAYKAK